MLSNRLNGDCRRSPRRMPSPRRTAPPRVKHPRTALPTVIIVIPFPPTMPRPSRPRHGFHRLNSAAVCASVDRSRRTVTARSRNCRCSAFMISGCSSLSGLLLNITPGPDTAYHRRPRRAARLARRRGGGARASAAAAWSTSPPPRSGCRRCWPPRPPAFTDRQAGRRRLSDLARRADAAVARRASAAAPRGRRPATRRCARCSGRAC